MKYLFGIIGHPLTSTLSPKIHSLFYQYYNLNAEYSVFPLLKEEVEPFLDKMRHSTLRGLSVTIPYKEYVLPLLDYISPLAKTAGSVNTISEKNGMLFGENTDVFGILAALSSYTDTTKMALILGSGGAARSAILALKQKHIHSIVIAGRNIDNMKTLEREFSVLSIQNTDIHSLKNVALIINTTPLASIGYESISPLYSTELLILKKNQTIPLSYPPLVFDMNYTVCNTILAKEASCAGYNYISGLCMLLAQAQQQFALWKHSIE